MHSGAIACKHPLLLPVLSHKQSRPEARDDQKLRPNGQKLFTCIRLAFFPEEEIRRKVDTVTSEGTYEARYMARNRP